MARRRLRVLLLDFGGVIAEEGFLHGLQALARAQGLPAKRVRDAGVEAVYASGYVVGAGSEADFWQRLRDAVGLEGSDETLRSALLERFVVRDWMLDLAIRTREAGISTAILSDQTDWLTRLDRRDGFSSAFDRIFNSYHLGRSKRDPELFDEVVSALEIAPDEALFVDDTRGNVERARRRGLNALVYRDRAQLADDLRAWPELPPLGVGDGTEAEKDAEPGCVGSPDPITTALDRP